MSASLTESDEDGRAGGAAMKGRDVDEDVAELPQTASSSSQMDDTTDQSDSTEDQIDSNEVQNNINNHEDEDEDEDEDDDAKTIREADVAEVDGTAADGVSSSGSDRTDGDAEKRTIGQIPKNAVDRRYRELLDEDRQDSASEDGSSVLGLPRRPGSPAGSMLSAADSSLSTNRSVVSSASSRFGMRSGSPSFRPFDQRFQSRIASPVSLSSSMSSSMSQFGFLNSHSRSVSMSSQFRQLEMGGGVANANDPPSPPWDVVRWTKLTKITAQAFSESAKRNFGSPTCMAIATSIVLGTTKGILLLFDYNQNLKMIIGPGTHAVESGAVTAVAVSADHTTVAAGHADGSIFTWDTSRASRPFLHIPPLDPAQVHPGQVGQTGQKGEQQRGHMDGHLHNVAITNLGFLGSRRTALVSADDRGMAFAHLATRGTGSLGRTVKTNRILGRYPGSKPPPPSASASRRNGKPPKPIKPSTVLAFAPLPLGNVDRATDTMGLTAMLTPYLLVIVSTTPVANTQHKAPRPKEVAPHSAMSGCLAWFPAVKLKTADARTGDTISKAKLVYCWSNVLTVLDVDEVHAGGDKDKPASLHCKARSRWKSEEALVAVQWLTRSVLAVLTISQRLIVLEDYSLRVTEAFDLISRYIYHADLFSTQLHAVVETLEDEDDEGHVDTSLHGVVADAFFMSFKSYKGRLFLLGFGDMAIGALSNWADRLIALMEHGDYVGAIRLATSFYAGDAEKLTIGLPEDTATRHAMVRERILEIMTASLKFAFGQRARNRAAADDAHLTELAQTCLAACESVDERDVDDFHDFLFGDLYDAYDDAGVAGLFLETLEPYILDQTITAVPPTVVKGMVAHYVHRGLESRLEEMICHMNTMTLDLDQVTTLCRQHGLYDALLYVWNQAMGDFITPLMDLLRLLIRGQEDEEEETDDRDDRDDVNALKMFPYLSYILTGRVYPTGATMDEATQQQAKAEIFWFLFCGKSVVWPHGSGHAKAFLTRPGQAEEPSFPYLRLILKFHAPSFLSALNEAFEDPFLNDAPDKPPLPKNNNSEEMAFGQMVNRQYIVTILTEIMMNPAEFAAEDTIYLDMFIARNLPKYPQYLLIPESTLSRVLDGLCRYPGSDLAEDAQLSAEYLLSVYHPPDMADRMPQFQAAGFYRILKRTYRVDRQYARLLQTYFEDPDDRHDVFGCIGECIEGVKMTTERTERGSRENHRRQAQEVQAVYAVLRDHARELVELDAAAAGSALDVHASSLHQTVLDAVEDRPDLQYLYLQAVMEGDHPDDQRQKHHATPLIEQYVRLLCAFAPAHVRDYVGLVQSTDLRLDALLPTMEETGVVDAAVVLMAREGQVQAAMERLVRHLHTLEAALQGIWGGESDKDERSDKNERSEEKNERSEEREGENERSEDKKDERSEETKDDASTTTVVQKDATEELIKDLQKYTHVGIWLCQGQTKTMRRHKGNKALVKSNKAKDEELSTDEQLWLDLVDTTVQITRHLSLTLQPNDRDTAASSDKLLGVLRSLVQHTFTALLTATAVATSAAAATTTANKTAAKTDKSADSNSTAVASTNPSFLRIMTAFLTRAAATSPSLAELRAVLASIFAAYHYEEAILQLANRLLERSLFADVRQAAVLRQRGWRAKGSLCEACGRRVWGPGLQAQQQQGRGVYAAWEARQAAVAARKERRQAARLAERDPGKGKAKEEGEEVGSSSGSGALGALGAVDSGPSPELDTPGPLVLFACRHIYHRSCLDLICARQGNKAPAVGPVPEYSCPIDG